MFATGCSPLIGHRVGNMTLLSAGRPDAVGGRLTLIGWFIVAAVCLSPILTFWIGAVLGRFSAAQAAVAYAEGRRCRCRSVGVDRPG